MMQQLGLVFDAAETPAVPPSISPAPPPAVLVEAPVVAAVSTTPADATTDDAPAASLEPLAQQLEAHPDYRVLRRLVPCLCFDAPAAGDAPAGIARVLILDTETTGLSHASDKIMELALLRVDVDRSTGQPMGPVQVYDGLEDPGQPIPPEVQAITGISDVMVQGQRLDVARIVELLDGVDLVIAHNAAFDRPFVEARLPAFAAKAWACSFADIDWKGEGRGSSKLESLAMGLGWFYDAHRAEMDCHALLAVLAAPLPNTGETGLARLLAAAQATSYRVQATGSPFSSKDALRARGYRWDAERKVWHTQVGNPVALEAECEWLKKDVYGGRSARIDIERQTALERFSSRAGECLQRDL